MAAPIILVAAIICNITHPIVSQLIDNLPDNEWQLAYVPEVLVDVACLEFNHTPFSVKVAKNIGPHMIKALRALYKYSKGEAPAPIGLRGSNKWITK